MCGIAGLINPLGIPLAEFSQLKTADPDLLAKGMLGLILHRGPDEMGVLKHSQGFLASARLSIVDISHGTQPLSNEDRSVWVTYNGEIYDIDRKISHLKSQGHSLRTRSDTEVLVHLYEEYGKELVNQLNGEFAFCMYDAKNGKHFLVRDPFGTKPLYYRELGNQALLFASEIKPLLWASVSHPSISSQAISQTLQSWVALPPTSSFKEVQQLPPGSILEIDRLGNRKLHRFTYRDSHETYPHAGLDSLLQNAVKRRLVADVPVGVYLSGGLDSSVLTYLASELSSGPVSSFSVTFSDPRFDESSLQEEVSKKYGTKHHLVKIDSETIQNTFREAVISGESLVFRSAFVPMYLLSRLAHSTGIKVVLSGEGADEILGGYDIFKELLILKQWSESPESDQFLGKIANLYPYLPQFKKENLRFLAPFYRNYTKPQSFWGHRIRWSHFASLSRLLVPELSQSRIEEEVTALIGDFPLSQTEAQCQATEWATLLHGYLLSTQGDRMANAHSIELRLPFLDREVVRFGGTNSLADLLPDLKEKALLRDAFCKHLPNSVSDKGKTPYLAPDSEVFLLSQNLEWKDYLTEASLARTEAFLPAPTLKFIADLETSARRGEVISRSKHTFFFTLLSTLILQEEIKAHLTPKPVEHLLKFRQSL